MRYVAGAFHAPEGGRRLRAEPVDGPLAVVLLEFQEDDLGMATAGLSFHQCAICGSTVPAVVLLGVAHVALACVLNPVEVLLVGIEARGEIRARERGGG